jgi:hypothetical protein
MSVAEAQQEVDFIEEFQSQVKEMVRLVEAWEEQDAQFIASNPTGNLPADPHRHAYNPSYENLHDQISGKLARFKELCNRYGTTFSENILFVVPTEGRGGGGVRAGTYRFAFPEGSKRQILRTILGLRARRSDTSNKNNNAKRRRRTGYRFRGINGRGSGSRQR